MTMAEGAISLDGRQRIEAYLEKLRKSLAGISREDALDIVRELRSHILEKAAEGGELTTPFVEATLSALGSPHELAAQYLADNLLARAARSRSPIVLLHALIRWASLSIAGLFVLLGCIVGYVVGASLVVCAILKPLHPRTGGLWKLSDESYSLRLGFGNVPAFGRELLGWWIVLVGLLAGGGLCLVTSHFALWCVRKYRRSHNLPRA
jgi:Protein of unknown function (DUF1700)